MNKVEIYAMSIATVLNDPIDKILSMFEIERQKAILTYRFSADRNRTAYGELLARWLMRQKTNLSLAEIHFQRDAFGKPYCPGCKYLFNLSHSGQWIVCSIGTVASGVDVEIQQEIDLAIAREYFLPKEYAWLCSLEEHERNVAMLKFWTLKESYLKYTGQGLLGELEKVDCQALLVGDNDICARNFLLKGNDVAGICTRKGYLPDKVSFVDYCSLMEAFYVKNDE